MFVLSAAAVAAEVAAAEAAAEAAAAKRFLTIDIRFNVKIKCYGVPYYYHFFKTKNQNQLC